MRYVGVADAEVVRIRVRGRRGRRRVGVYMSRCVVGLVELGGMSGEVEGSNL